MTIEMLRRFSQLQRNQWLDPESLAEIQRTKLQKLIRHVYDNVPYYRRLMDQTGMKPSSIQEPKDLSKFPITRKSQIVGPASKELLARGVNPKTCIDLKTSGSQGMPIIVRFTHDDRSWWKLLALRGWIANGYRPWHSMFVLNDSRFAPHGRQWFEYLRLFRQNYTSIYEHIGIQVDAGRTIRPDVVRGITSDVLRFAQALQDRGDHNFTPNLVLTSAELADDATRHQIAAVFNTTSVDFYGAIECGWIAWECPHHSGYHINSDCLIVEFLRDGVPVGPGESGEIVVTNLHADAMPFIRYSLGDIGIPKQERCACGRGLPLMTTVEGRIADCIVLPDGQRISPYRITCTVERISGIARYQIIQTSPHKILVRMMPNDNYDQRTAACIKSELDKLLAGQLAIDIELVEEFQKGRGGKFRVVMSKFDARD